MSTVSRCGMMNSNQLKSLDALAPLSLPIRMMVERTVGRVVGRVHEDTQEYKQRWGGGGTAPVVREFRITPSDTHAIFSKTGSISNKLASPKQFHLALPISKTYGLMEKVSKNLMVKSKDASDVARIPRCQGDKQGLNVITNGSTVSAQTERAGTGGSPPIKGSLDKVGILL